jgi:BMFP domain-containing protein YqiC
MQSDNRFFDDLSRLINGAAGTFAGMSREAGGNAREKAREWIGGLDFVSRDEFEAVKTMAAEAREKVALLEARIAAMEQTKVLEARIAALEAGSAKPAKAAKSSKPAK